MASKTEICNQALVLIGGGLISDFISDTTKAGQLCRLFYDSTVEELLEQYPWTFAAKRINLSAPTQDEPKFGFENSFQLPADYLDIHETNLLDGSWRVEDLRILTNADEISIVYVARITDTSKYTPLFRQTLIYLLAAKLAIPLTRSLQMATLYHQAVERTLSRSENANSHPNNEKFESDTLIQVRR